MTAKEDSRLKGVKKSVVSGYIEIDGTDSVFVEKSSDGLGDEDGVVSLDINTATWFDAERLRIFARGLHELADLMDKLEKEGE